MIENMTKIVRSKLTLCSLNQEIDHVRTTYINSSNEVSIEN